MHWKSSNFIFRDPILPTALMSKCEKGCPWFHTFVALRTQVGCQKRENLFQEIIGNIMFMVYLLHYDGPKTTESKNMQYITVIVRTSGFRRE